MHDKIVNYDEMRGWRPEEPSAEDMRWFYEQQQKKEMNVQDGLHDLDRGERDLANRQKNLDREQQKLNELQDRKARNEQDMKKAMDERNQVRDRMERFLNVLRNPDISDEAKRQIANQLSDLQDKDIELSRRIRGTGEGMGDLTDSIGRQKDKVNESQKRVDEKKQEVDRKKNEVDQKIQEAKLLADQKANEKSKDWQERKERLRKEREEAGNREEEKRKLEEQKRLEQEKREREEAEQKQKTQDGGQPETGESKADKVGYNEDVNVDDTGIGGIFTDPGVEDVNKAVSEKIIGNTESSNKYDYDEGLRAFQHVYRGEMAKEALREVSNAVIEGTLSQGLKGLKAAGKAGEKLAGAIEGAMEAYDSVKSKVENAQQAIDIIQKKLGSDVQVQNQTWRTGNIIVAQSTVYNKKTGDYVTIIKTQQEGSYRGGSGWTTFGDRDTKETTTVISGKVNQDKSWF